MRETNTIKTINFTAEIEHGKTIIEARPTPIFYETDEGGGGIGGGSTRQSTAAILAREAELRDLDERAQDEGLTLSAKEQAEIDVLNAIQQGYERYLKAKITLDGEAENLTIRNRSEAIRQAEAEAGIRYPYHFVWLDGAEKAAGTIEFPWDGYSKVYAVKGGYDDKPEIVFLDEFRNEDPDEAKPGDAGERTPKKPYFERTGGKTIIYMDGFSGAGTEQSPFEVATLAELQKVGSGDDGWDDDAYYIQTADIDMSSVARWYPVGASSYSGYFYGDFNGQGYKLSGMTETVGGVNYFGLFVRNSGRLININLVDVYLRSQLGNGGIVCGENTGTIHSCRVSGSIQSSKDVAGFAHRNGGNNNYIYDCYTDVSVTGTGSANAAGFLRNAYRGQVNRCLAIGPIAVTGTGTAGGLAFTGSSGYFNNCFWDMNATGVDWTWNDRGTGLTTAEAQSLDTYLDAGWDICAIEDFDPDDPTTWFIDDGNDYPRLWWEWLEDEPEIPEAGAETAITINAEAGAGIKRAEAGAEAGTGVSASGAGVKAASGGVAEAVVRVYPEADAGQKVASGAGAETGISIEAKTSAGVKAASSETAEAGVEVHAEKGAGLKVGHSGVTETAVTVAAEGYGIKHKTAGAEAGAIVVDAEAGPGIKGALAGKEAAIGIVAAASHGLKISFAGAEAVISVDLESGIAKTSCGGTAEAGIVVTATGAGGRTIAFGVVIRLPSAVYDPGPIRLPAAVYDTAPIRVRGAVYDPAPIRLEGVVLHGYKQ